jgi:adsorption protein A
MMASPIKSSSVLLAGLLSALSASSIAQAEAPLPLSGPAYQLADDAYKAYEQGDYDRAIRQVREAIRLRPDTPRLRQLLAQAEQARAGRRRDGAGNNAPGVRMPSAKADRTRGASTNPAFAAATAAYKAYDRRDYATAVGDAREATRLEPVNRSYWSLLVNSLIAANRPLEAELALDQGLRAAGDHAGLRTLREPIHRALAQAAGAAMYRALEAGDVQAATVSARSAVAYAPDNAGYRLTLISVLLRGEQFEEAENLAGETIAVLPDSTVALALRAYARQRLGRAPDARADLDRALAQRELPPAAERHLRLIAADSELAAREPQRAIDLLQGLPEGDAQAAARRAAAQRTHRRPVPTVLTSASFPPPTLDCGSADAAQTCALLPGQPPRDPAFDLAAAAYKSLDARDFQEAADKARQAVTMSPNNRDYQLLLLNALIGAGRVTEAEQAASAALALNADDGGLLAQRGALRKRLGNNIGAAEDFNAALHTGQLPAATEIAVLADLDRKREARLRFVQAQAGELANASDIDMGYLAARIGDDEGARLAFARADGANTLPETALQDSAYAALRAGNDAEAVTYFKRTIDAQESLKLRLEPQLLFDTRRAVAEITREGGVIASLTYRGGGSGVVSGFGATPGVVGSKTAQAGVEAYWRPFGYRNGRYLELFARGFETLYSQAGGATGGNSLQTAVGIRWKPLSQHNAVLSLSRVFTHGASDDWLAQAAYSLDRGTDLRVDVPDWWTTRVSAEVGRYTENPQTYGLASVEAGRSYRLGSAEGKTVLFPHVVAAAEYNSLLSDKLAVGAGPGVSLRYWFREDRYAAPRSYVDFSLQYRVRVSGDDRARGIFLTSLISY